MTLDWLMGRLGDRSCSVVLLLLALLGLLPGVSAAAGVLLAVPAFQMILARRAPVFPRRVASRRFEVLRLARVAGRTVPVLRWPERFMRPRWPTPFGTTERAVGAVVLLLAGALLAPVPLSNVAPALATSLIAFAHLAVDGVLLCAGLAAGVTMLAVAAAVVREAASAAGWVPGLLQALRSGPVRRRVCGTAASRHTEDAAAGSGAAP